MGYYPGGAMQEVAEEDEDVKRMKAPSPESPRVTYLISYYSIA